MTTETVDGQSAAEAWPPEQAWTADQIGSRCALAGHTWSDRIDPMWSGMLDDDARAAWSSASGLRRLAAESVVLAPKRALTRGKDEAVEAVLSPQGRSTRLRVLSAAHLWRCTTAQQLAALTGSVRAESWTSFEMLPLYQAGLVDVGRFREPGIGVWAPDTPTAVLRPSDSTTWDKQVAPRLAWTEWLAVSAGLGWSGGRGRGSDRHNILATEFGLRMMEAGQVCAVLPEGLCDAAVLTGDLDGRGGDGTADVGFVRADGARIAVEVTANLGDLDKLDRKIRKWARLLARPCAEARSSAVVFLAAPRNPGGSNPAAIRRGLMRAVARVVERDCLPAGVAARLGVASWREWFPAERMASQAWFDLSVVVPVGGGWRRVSWMGDAPVWAPRAEDAWALGSVAEQTRVLAGIPRWFRDGGEAPVLVGLLMRAAGRTGFPSRPRTGGAGVPVGAGWGAAGPAKAPFALLNRL